MPHMHVSFARGREHNGEVRHGAPLKINGKRWRAVRKTRAYEPVCYAYFSAGPKCISTSVLVARHLLL